jgi:hypothetical protein
MLFQRFGERAGPDTHPRNSRHPAPRQRIQIDSVPAILKEDPLAPFAVLRHRMRKPWESQHQQHEPCPDDRPSRRIGIISPIPPIER